MAYVTKDALALLPLVEREEPSAVFGGVLCLRELTRAQYKAVVSTAVRPDKSLDADVFNAGLFGAGVVDPSTKAPLWTPAQLLDLPARNELWNEIGRVADIIYGLLEVSPAAFRSGVSEPDA